MVAQRLMIQSVGSIEHLVKFSLLQALPILRLAPLLSSLSVVAERLVIQSVGSFEHLVEFSLLQALICHFLS